MKNPANVSEQFVEAVPGGKVIVELFTRRRGRNVRRTRMTVWRGDVAHQRTVHTIWPEHERQRFAAEFFAGGRGVSWFFSVVWLLVAAGIIFAARDMMNVEARYRTGAAIAAGVLWPIRAIMLAAFLLADLIEWLVGLAVDDGDAA